MTFQELFGGEKAEGRGIDPDDPWLKPYADADKRSADDAELGRKNAIRIEAEHKRLIAAGKMKPRPPMKQEASS